MSNASSKKQASSAAPVVTRAFSYPEQYRAANWSPWWGLIMITASFLGAQIVAVILMSAIPDILQMTNSHAAVWLNSTVGRFLFVAFAEGAALLFVWLFLRDRLAANMRAIGITRSWQGRDVGYALAGAVGYYIVFGVASALLSKLFSQDFTQRQETGFTTVASRPELLMTFAGLVILPPVVEEILFRGVLFGGLRRRFSFVWAALITGLAFALPHLAESKDGGVLWLAGIDTLTLSFFLCYLREKTGSLWASIFLHMTKNGIAFFFLFIIGQSFQH